MRRIIGPMLPLLIVAASMSVPPARTQEVPQEITREQIGGAFVDTLDVQAVNVEVVVTDRRGHRVTGLTAADFHLLVDGKPVSLDYFAEIRDGRAVPPPVAPGGGPATLPPALTELGAGDEVGTNYLVFIDEFFSPYRLRNEALKVLAHDLGTLGPRDRMAVVAFEGRRLRTIADWTAPSPALAATLREAAKRKGYLTVADLGGNEGLLPLRASGGFLMADTGLQPGDMEADREESRLARQVITAAAGALRALEPPPGRKVALILSGGWKLDPRAAANRYDQAKEYMAWGDPLSLLRPLTDAANRLGYTVYPVHLADTLLPSAADRTTATPGAIAVAGGAMANAVRQGSLVFSAEETGGQLLRPGARHLRRIAEDTRSYYWLGFTNAESDNRRRSLRVEVLYGGLQVRARSSFVPLSRQTRTSMAVEGALLTGEPIPGARSLDVEVGTPEARGRSTAMVPLTFRLPAEAITLLPTEGYLVAHLEMWMTAIDPSGGRSELVVVPGVLKLEAPPAPGQQVVYRTSIEVRRRPQEVQLALTDAASGEMFSARIRLDL